MKNKTFRFVKTVAHSTVAPVIWPARLLGPGTKGGWVPRGRRLLLPDLKNHSSIHATEIYPAARIGFQPLWLDNARRARVLADIADDDFTNERKPGLLCELAGGRLIHSDYVLTPEDDFFADLRFPRVIMPEIRDLEALRLPQFGRPRRLRGTALFLDSLPNIYHCLFDAIGRIGMAVAAGFPVETFDYFVSSPPSAAFERELLERAGVSPNRIVSPAPHLEFDRLVFSPLPFGVSSEWCSLVRAQCTSLQPKISTTPLPRRIYLSRGSGAKLRKVLNEDDVIKLLKTYDIQTFAPHEHDLSTQRAVFENLELVVSAHGAGLANLLWAKPGTRVIELRSLTHLRGYWKLYWNISSVLHLRHAWVCCEASYSGAEPRCSSGQYDDLTVPLGELRSALDALE